MTNAKIQSLVDEAIELQRAEDEAREGLKAIKKKLRAAADRLRKGGETLLKFPGSGGMVKVVYGERLELNASYDDVLRALGSVSEQVFDIDRSPKIKVPSDFEERLKALGEEQADQARLLTAIKQLTPKVQIEALAS